MKRLLVGIGAFALLAAIVSKAYEIAAQPGVSANSYIGLEPQNGQAPSFELKTRDGRSVKLADFSGRYVFLNFWATWCPSCRAEMPSLEELAHSLEGKLTIVAASVDESWGNIDGFFQGAKPGFEVLHDAGGKWAQAFGTEKFPETYLIDPKGQLVAKFVGPRDWSDEAFEVFLRSQIEQKKL